MDSARALITKEQSDILVAIGKIETQMIGLVNDVAGARGEIKEINTGITARLLNLESNAVSKIEVMPRIAELEKRMDTVQDDLAIMKTRLEAYWKAIAVVGSIVVVVLGIAEVVIRIFF